jgi:Ca2+-binding RTX toxin-like protein
MNYRKILERLILILLFCAFKICFLPVSIFGEDFGLYPTGLLPPTEEEKILMEKEWRKIDTVSPNEIAIDRINKKRQEENLPELNQEEVELIWQDNIDEIKRESVLNSRQLPEYLPFVDNSKLPAFPPIRSQESFPSCAPFSVTYYQLTHMVSLQEGWNNKNEDNSTKFSPKWTYNFLNKGELYGVSWYSTYNLLEKHGGVTWEEFPYVGLTGDPKNYREWCLDTEAWENALHYRINPVEYLYLDTATGFEQFKQLIINGYVLIFGTYINSWAYTYIEDDPSTSDDDEFVGERASFWMKGTKGAHSMTVVGYNDTIWIDINQNDIVDTGEKGAFRVANSWGLGWEDEGFTWVAYDALYTESQVPGGPSEDRWMIFMNQKVMLLTVKESYEPSAVAKFTVNHAKRAQMGFMLGMSETNEDLPASIWTPGALIFQGGEFAFDGTATPTDGTFILDFTDLINTYGNEGKAFYLKIEDNAANDAVAVKDYRVIDYQKGGITYISSEVPQDVDAESLNFRVLGFECDGKQPTIFGTEGHDFIEGTEGPDVIHALGGNDVIIGLGGNDVICGGEGQDGIGAGAGNDIVFGEKGNDAIWGGSGNDILRGDDGNDSIYGGPGNDVLRGNYGNDSLYGKSGVDKLYGGWGPDNGAIDNNDTCYDATGTFNWGCEVFYQQSLSISISASLNDQSCNGKMPTILGTEGHDFIEGTSGPDVIHGLGGNDVISGLGGDDIICGGDGMDVVGGGTGNDIILGENGHDSLWGGSGNDTLHGGEGNDTISGGSSGNDRLYGNYGNDSLYGKSEDDKLYGGWGPDNGSIDNNDTCYGERWTFNWGCEVFYEE